MLHAVLFILSMFCIDSIKKCSGFVLGNSPFPPSCQSRAFVVHQKSYLDTPKSNSILFLQTENKQIDVVKVSANVLTNETLADVEQPRLSPWLGFLVLNSIAVLWGSQHVVIKSTLDSFHSTSLLNSWRFALSTLLFLPSFAGSLKNKSPAFPAGMELGLYTFLGFAFQAIGLETTTASRSAFLLYLNVKFVPFLAAVLLARKIPGVTWLSAALALTGTFFLSTDGGAINTGDLWCIVAAVASAMFILRLESFSVKFDAAELSSISFATVAGLCGLWVVGDTFSGRIDTDNLLNSYISPFMQSPWALLYLGVVTTGLGNYLQTIGQRSVSAERAAIIYSMDPVYGAVFSNIFLGEQFGVQGFAGAALIMLGIWVSSVFIKADSPTQTEKNQ